MNSSLSEYLIGIGDDLLILGHRLSEWCGHAHGLEEDIALANIALDCIGQAAAYFTLAAAEEGKGRSADDIAFLRECRDFKNYQLLEQPNGDFAVTIVRQTLFDGYALPFFNALSKSSNREIAGAAGKSVKEITYHLRHAKNWFLRLALGTEESKRRMQSALDLLWEFTYELGSSDPDDAALIKSGIVPDLKPIRKNYEEFISALIKEAGLNPPADTGYRSSRSRKGIHTEYLGHLLAEMQSLHRAHPGAQW
jgi:ring-1,2-phenylacetyl-CoA epoxidase subunit PaaC